MPSPTPDYSERQKLLQSLLAEEEAGHGYSFSSPRRRDSSASSFPTSFAQERLWFVDQVSGDGGAYNIPHALRLRGLLDVDALEWALRNVVRRHEVLRTRFPTVEGRPVQVVGDGTELRLSHHDFSADADPERSLWEHASAEAMLPFDLGSGKLLRAELVRLGEDDRVLLLTVHHIVSDGWSTGVMVKEVAALYTAYVRSSGQTTAENVLPPLPIQYSDFAQWQREQADREPQEKHLAYWGECLAGIEPVRLPADRPRPDDFTGVGDTLSFEVPEAVRSRLLKVGDAEGATLFMVLAAAFSHVLSRLSGQTDVGMGTYLANRSDPQLESLIGFFVNTLVLRVDTGGDLTFRQLVSRARAVCLDAYEHQDAPFERVVERLRPGRDRAQLQPLFNVTCMLQNAPQTRFDLGGVTVEVIDRHTWTTKSDLGFIFWEGIDDSAGLTGWCEFSTELFDRSTAERMTAHVLRVLEAGSREPDTPLSLLDSVSEAERRQQVRTWNPPVVESASDRTVREVFAETVSRSGDATAIVAEAGSIGFRELDGLANRVTALLRDRGVGPGDHVCLVGTRSIDTVAGLLGIVKSGAVLVLVDPLVSAAEWSAIVRDTDPPAVVCANDSVPDLDELPPVIIVVDDQVADPPPLVRAEADHPACVVYPPGPDAFSAGTTIQHGALVDLVDWFRTKVCRGSDEGQRRGCFDLDRASGALLGDVVLLLNGERVYMPASGTRKDSRRMAAYLRANQIDFLATTGKRLEALEERNLVNGGCLRTVVLGGESLPSIFLAVSDSYEGIDVWNLHGPCGHDSETSTLPVSGQGFPVLGRPVPHTRARVLDDALALVPTGAWGGLYSGGAATGLGFPGRPRLTAETFIPDPYADAPGSRMYRTGDVVAYTDGGSLQFHSRRGHAVQASAPEPDEVVSVLREHPGVADAHIESFADADADAGTERYTVAFVAAEPSLVAESGIQDQVSSWRQVFDLEQASHASDVTFNTAGWKDAVSLTQIPETEMAEFRDLAVARILALQPRDLLELGCGTGLILYGLGDRIQTYAGVDFSAETIGLLRDAVVSRPPGPELELLEGEAARPPVDGLFDTVVLNSVVQYFPRADYLRETLIAITDRLTADGSVFLGDLRTPRLLWATHAWVEMAKADPEHRIDEVAGRIETAVARDRELVVAPEFLEDIIEEVLPGAWLECLVHEGRSNNELIRFRYDAVLHRAAPEMVVEPRWLDEGQPFDETRAVRLLAEHEDTAVGWRRIPNSRLRRERALAKALASPEQGLLLSDVANSDVVAGVDPRVFADIAEAAGREAKVFFSPGHEDGAIDVVFLPQSLRGRRVRVVRRAPEARAALSGFNRPDEAHRRLELQSELRQVVAGRVSEQALPSRFVVLDRLPTGTDGEVDTKALRTLEHARGVAAGEGTALEGLYELIVGRVWRELLEVDRVAAEDDFFGLGGHSLMAASLVNRINQEFSGNLSIRDVIDHPVLSDLAKVVRERASGASSGPPLLPVLRDEFMPLSLAQEHLWAAERMEGATDGGYNMHHCLRIEGELDEKALTLALHALITRNEVLRTRFPIVNGGPVQQVRPVGDNLLRHLDVSSHPDPEKAAAEFAEAEITAVFDLEKETALRASLVSLASDDHLLVVVIHHIASDGWSNAVILRDLMSDYALIQSGAKGTDIPELPVQYVDYAVWHRQWLEAGKLERQLAFWRDHLAGSRPAPLPRTGGEPEASAPRGESVLFEVPSQVLERLERFSQAEGVTLFMTMMSGFLATMSALTQRTDLVVGTLVSGRQHFSLESMVGFFVNQVAVRVDCARAANYRGLLSSVRTSTLLAHANQDAPFTRVVNELVRSEDRVERSPFDVVFELDDASPDLLDVLNGIRITDYPVVKQATKYPLTMIMSRRKGKSCSVEFRADLISRDDIQQLVDRFLLVLERIPSMSDASLAELTVES